MQRLPSRLHDLLHQRAVSPRLWLAARWRHGRYLLAEEKDLIALPDELTYADGAQVACGFGTVYEGLEKIGISGNHAVLITGLGPVGLATAALCRKLGAERIIGIDVVPERLELAKRLGLCDDVLRSSADNVQQVRDLTGGQGVERAVDCSANAAARATAIRATRKWGRIVLVGEGGTLDCQPIARYDPRPENHLRLLGHLHLAHGGTGGAPGPLEAPSRGNRYPPLRAGAGAAKPTRSWPQANAARSRCVPRAYKQEEESC